jgi:BA14K-like protein
MTIKRTILSLAAASGITIFLAASAASAAPLASLSTLALSERSTVVLQVEPVQYYGRRYARPGRVYGRPVYGRGYGRGAVGAGIAAGVLGGIAAGALLAPGPVYAAPVYSAPVYGYPAYAAPEPVYGSPVGSDDYCAQTYRSYNPSTGTYVGRDGRVRYCP